jgi:hypothetical protein
MNTPEMSLRDWFAGQALSALAAKVTSLGKIAEDAYKIADAMMIERGKDRGQVDTRTPRPGV